MAVKKPRPETPAQTTQEKLPTPSERFGDVRGHTIVEVRQMTDKELKNEDWTVGRHQSPTVLVLDNGILLYPSRDHEGNGPGALFGATKNGQTFRVD